MTDISHETIHMAEKEETNQNIEIVERPRRRQKMKTTTRTKEDRKTIKKKPPKEKQPLGRPRIYAVGTILKPKDPDYFKKYYVNVVNIKNARRLLQLPSPEMPTPEQELSS